MTYKPVGTSDRPGLSSNLGCVFRPKTVILDYCAMFGSRFGRFPVAARVSRPEKRKVRELIRFSITGFIYLTKTFG